MYAPPHFYIEKNFQKWSSTWSYRLSIKLPAKKGQLAEQRRTRYVRESDNLIKNHFANGKQA